VHICMLAIATVNVFQVHKFKSKVSLLQFNGIQQMKVICNGRLKKIEVGFIKSGGEC